MAGLIDPEQLPDYGTYEGSPLQHFSMGDTFISPEIGADHNETELASHHLNIAENRMLEEKFDESCAHSLQAIGTVLVIIAQRLNFGVESV